MSALPLFQLVDPGLCACGERLEHPDEIAVGSCYFCMAEAAMTEPDREDMHAEVIESNNIRSRHYRRAV